MGLCAEYHWYLHDPRREFHQRICFGRSAVSYCFTIIYSTGLLTQVIHEEEEPLVFSFYQDMSKNPHVIKLMLQLNQAVHKVFSMMNKYLDGWRRYDTVYNLWNPKRKQALEKLAEKKHTCVYFDTRIASYELLAETVRVQPSEKDVDFIRIDCDMVALGIAAQADEWKTDYGAVLHQCSSVLLEELCAKMSQVGALKS